LKSFGWFFYIGIFLTLSVYHFAVYLGRREEKINLYYSLLGISYLFWQISKTLIKNYIDSLFIKTSLTFLSLMLVSLAFVLFTYFALELKKTKKLIIIGFPILLILPTFLGVLLLFIFKNIILSSIIVLIPGIIFALTLWVSSSYLFFILKYYKYRWKLYIYIGITGYIIFYIIYPILVYLNVNEFIMVLISTNGILIWLFISANSITNNFNAEHRSLVILKNTLEKKVQERTEELRGLYEEKTNFYVNLAHELKTPLTLIDNYLDNDIMKRGKSKDLDIVKQNIDLLKKDMSNLLDLEKLDRGLVFYDHDQTINFSNLLEKKLILFNEIVQKRNIKLIKKIQKDLFIKIDPFALDRIINNLIENAIKYNKDAGVIEVVLKNNYNKIEFIVNDSGIGIAEDQKLSIFKAYHQLSHKKRNLQGLGMGLSIVKKIMDDVNGIINVNSEINKGTSFTLIFNKYKVSKDKNKNDIIELIKPIDSIVTCNFKEERYLKNKKNLLIIEDNIELLYYLQENLYNDYNVFIAENGLKALDKIKNMSYRINLVVSDIMMDGMNGYEFYNEFNKDQNNNAVPFIFLTAKTSINDKIEGLKKGAVDYICKPFSIDELKTKIYSLIRLQENLKKVHSKEIGIKFSKIINNELNGKNDILTFNMICNENKVSKNEQEIIQLLINGLEYKEISAKLEISINVVKKRIHNIYKKLCVKNKVELVNFFTVK